MRQFDDIPIPSEFDDILPDDASTFMERLSGTTSDYEMLDREWIAGAGL